MFIQKVESALSERAVALTSFEFSDQMKELDDQVKSMMKMSQNFYLNGKERMHICTVCGKEGKGKNIKDHIEANHLEGVSIPCNYCEKTSRSRKNHRRHLIGHNNQ